ncbi:MAG: thiamine-phosphate kinase [Rhodospirillales bacterium]
MAKPPPRPSEGPSERPGEFDLIATYFAPLAADAPGALGLRDDAAVLAVEPGREMVVTTDTTVAGVHFFIDAEPEEIAHKILTVNVSDLAAMGADPIGYVLSTALSDAQDSAWLERFSKRLHATQRRYGLSLFGGDTVATPGPLTLTITAFGTVPAGRAIKRSGAKPGDTVYVSGTIGDSALGLAALKKSPPGPASGLSVEHHQALIARYREPQARIDLGRRLRGLVHAMADVSDGLVADLGHICETSGVRAAIDASCIPLSDAAQSALRADPALLDTVLGGGDDYELVFTAPGESKAEIARLADTLDLAVTAIGTIGAGAGVAICDASGKEINYKTTGYRHF